MASTIPDMTKAARDRRQAAWQDGADWCTDQRLARRALADCLHVDPYDRSLFLQGIANELTAAGRKLAGLNPLEDRGL